MPLVANAPASVTKFLNQPLTRRLTRVSVWLLLVGYFAFGLLLLALRYAILPQIEHYRSDIEQTISKAAERPITIRQIKAHWEGWHPTLTLNGFAVRDKQGQVALAFDQVEAELSWKTLLTLRPRLARIEIDAPNLLLRRDGQGRFFVASLEVTPQPDDGEGFADWLLRQDRIVVRNATITWQDEQRQAPLLELKKLNIQIDNSGSRHRFGLTAEPPRALAARLDIRGDLKAADLDRIETWKGEAFAELDYADLAGWHAWVDYPIALTQGSGALRLWLNFANKQLTAATADIRLADVRLKLRSDLPELPLTVLDGRLGGRRLDDGFALDTKQLALTTQDGVTIPPTDAAFEWHAAEGKAPQGRVKANAIDLDALVRIAAHLPLDDAARAALAKHAPHGKLTNLRLDWQGTAGDPARIQTWNAAAHFTGVGFAAVDALPGVANFSGQIDGSERGGKLVLDSTSAAIDLPTLFAEPKIEFDTLSVIANWKAARDGLHVSLDKASFSNRDAAGDARGSWHALPDGPGEIDLTAKLTRGRGEGVWRYIPFAAGKETGPWLRKALLSGAGSETTLKLKGDLRDFPFRSDRPNASSKPGIFEVRGKFHDATLRYVEGWPDITGIEGELLFVGERMLITGKRARMFGVTLHDVRAEIADLEKIPTPLVITGKASGPTADFLRFIESSGVGDMIDHFTEDMRAEGEGELDLKLDLPLETIERAKVNGNFRFTGNKLKVDPDLPTLTDVNGQFKFSSDDLDARGITAKLLGTPLSVDIKTLGAGNVQVIANGEVSIPALRQQLPIPLLDHLSGGFKWNGQIKARKKSAEVRISSNLIGLSSSLPEPLNKAATDATAFSFERKPPPDPPRAKGSTGGKASVAQATPPRDLLELSIGRSVRAQLLRQNDSQPPRILRGVVALGDPAATSPERSVLLAANVPKLNLDFWRSAFTPKESATKGKNDAGPSLPELPGLQFNLRANEVILQDKTFHDLRLTGGRADATSNTRFDLKSRELAGNFDWNGAGKGKLVGRIDKFALPDNPPTTETLNASAGEVVKQLPALDITVDQLLYKDKSLGTARVTGENRNDYWHSKIDLKNDDGVLEANGRWRPSLSEPDTQIDFKLTAKSIEKLLNRIGYADAVKRGTANVSASLSWNGAPYAIDYGSLNGKLNLSASNGQFSQLEPGVGRLLGILSLQSLPRRITLDFRDIFSQGFAFDSIEGDFVIARGTMETSPQKKLQISGPAAKVVMDGTINLGNETQNLHVRVQPAVGESVAVGTMLANPVVGAAVWAAQKLLNDPLGQAFAFDYQVSGSWGDPKVEKLGATKAGEAKSVEQKK